jgi:hypothetical protein
MVPTPVGPEFAFNAQKNTSPPVGQKCNNNTERKKKNNEFYPQERNPTSSEMITYSNLTIPRGRKKTKFIADIPEIKIHPLEKLIRNYTS